MSIRILPSVRAVVFDYGNTLIEFGAAQIDHVDRALAAFLSAEFGLFDPERFATMRAEARVAPYLADYREVELGQLSTELVHALYSQAPSPEQLERMLIVQQTAFVESIRVETEVLGHLARLGSRYSLGLLSNYPSGPAIRQSLARTGIDGFLDHVVVSGEVGFVKPHPRTFEAIVGALGTRPEDTVHVGDNWLADIQGAKRFGLACIQMRRWRPLEESIQGVQDHQPDAIVSNLEQLVQLLLDPIPPLGDNQSQC